MIREFKPELTPRPKVVPFTDALKPPFDLEIGCGTGEFAIDWAKKQKTFIAIEKTRTRFFKFKKKLASLKPPSHLWPVHANAVWWLAHYASAQIAFKNIFFCYILNPYPKKSRWVNRPFMAFLLSLLAPKGFLELRSNKQDYLKEFKAKIKAFTFMQLIEDQKSPTPRTKPF